MFITLFLHFLSRPPAHRVTWFHVILQCYFLRLGFDVALNSEGISERQTDQQEWELICILQRWHSNWQPSLLFLLMLCIIHILLHIFFPIHISQSTHMLQGDTVDQLFHANCWAFLLTVTSLLSFRRALCLPLTTNLDDIKTCGKIYGVAWHHFYFLSLLISPSPSRSPFPPPFTPLHCVVKLRFFCFFTPVLWVKACEKTYFCLQRLFCLFQIVDPNILGEYISCATEFKTPCICIRKLSCI